MGQQELEQQREQKRRLRNKMEEKKQLEKTEEIKAAEGKKEAKKIETKKPKKTTAVVNSFNLPISTKHSIAICRFIKGKKIEIAISDLEKVMEKKKAIPMRGEIPHRKGKIMSGRYPKKAVSHFIKLLKSLLANVNFNNLENAVIKEAISNTASMPYGKFGRVRKKRTNVRLIGMEIKVKDREKNKEE